MPSTYPILIYRPPVLQLPCAELILLVRVLFHLFWDDKAPDVRRPVCCLHPSEGGLGMSNVKIPQQTLRFKFQDRMYQQGEGKDLFWKETLRRRVWH